MKLLVEGETATEVEDTERQKRKVIRCGLDEMCGHTKNVLNLKDLKLIMSVTSVNAMCVNVCDQENQFVLSWAAVRE